MNYMIILFQPNAVSAKPH